MTCDLCDQPAVVHLTAKQGAQGNPHLCQQHAIEAGFPVAGGPNAALADNVIPKLRKLVEFMKANNRTPTRAELEQLGGIGSPVQIDAADARFQQQVQFLELTIAFAERHVRLPSEGELPPDPF
jgi:hypothetical protein